MSKRNLQAVLRNDLTAFVEKAFETVSPGDRYAHNWHIEAITHQLIRCADGDAMRLLITQPPRSLKPICTSVAYVAWMLGRNPALKIICVSYSKDLSLDLARLCRNVMESDWYLELFPATQLKRVMEAELVTTEGGGRLATSIGGTLTGRGADIIIIDDPLKADDALSPIARNSVIEWYSGTVTTRLNDKQTGVIITVMQRLHEEDLAGYLIEQGGIEHLDLPAIAIADQDVELGDGRLHHRKEGDLLQPDREPIEVLDQLKRDLGSLKFSAQYQQRPIPAEGNLIKLEWLGRYKDCPALDQGLVIQSWDTASSVLQSADYSACVTALRTRSSIFIIDVWPGRLDYPDMKRKIATHAKRFRADQSPIEKAASGLQLLQDLREPAPGAPKPIPIKPDKDKLTRMSGASAMIENGEFLLPEDAPWLDTYLTELLAFPAGKHDDQADATSQLLNHVRHRLDRDRSDAAFIPELMPGIVLSASGNVIRGAGGRTTRSDIKNHPYLGEV